MNGFGSVYVFSEMGTSYQQQPLSEEQLHTLISSFKTCALGFRITDTLCKINANEISYTRFPKSFRLTQPATMSDEEKESTKNSFLFYGVESDTIDDVVTKFANYAKNIQYTNDNTND